MKRILTLIALLALQCQVVAQVTYERGYIIDNSGARKEMLILDKGWRSNPATISFKTSRDASVQTAGIADIEEFGVGDEIVFVKHNSRIDRSSERVGCMTTSRDPLFSQEEVFLKLLVKGEADLYQYREGDVQRYYCSLRDVAVKPLVHKKYLEEENRVQLYEQDKCRTQV